MPLHLLPKKSWHVYNSANVARVRADEAAAAAGEEREEQRMQEVDAARRLAILRGETPPPLEDDAGEKDTSAMVRSGDRRRDDADIDVARRGEKRKRKRRGEDDTDFEMRVAQERVEVADRARSVIAMPEAGDASDARKKREADVSIVDERGHIDLFGPAADTNAHHRDRRREDKNPEAEREKAEERAAHDVTMRFVDAGGRGMHGLKGQGPWYSNQGHEIEDSGPNTNAFGRPDEGRKGREEARIVGADPLAMVKSGAKRVREVDAGRRREREEREEELRALRKEERRRARRKRREGRHEEDDKNSLDGFSLDAPERETRSRSDNRRERNRSWSRERTHRHDRKKHDGDHVSRHRHQDWDEKDKHMDHARDRHWHRSRERSSKSQIEHAN